MTTYIDVEMAIGKLLTVDDQYSAERDFAVNAINSEPAADVHQVVHAHLIEKVITDEDGNKISCVSCSNCGNYEKQNNTVYLPGRRRGNEDP